MNKRIVFIVMFLVCFISMTGYGQAQKKWITAYYPLWAVPSMYPENLEYNKLTHLVHFSANPVRTSPYLDVLVPAGAKGFNQDSMNIQWGGLYNGNNPPIWRTIDIQKTLISKAHESGVKVILSVGGIYGTGAETMSWISKDPEKIKTFVAASCAYAKRKGYDGIELDWEFPRAADRQGFNMLIQQFRDHLNEWKTKGIFIASVHESPGAYFAYDRDSMIACFDQINPMTYEMYAGDFSSLKAGYNSPINLSTEFSEYNGYAIDQDGHGPKAWIKAGYPSQKIGLSISFLTTEFYSVSPPVQPARPFKNKNWGYYKNIPAVGRHWDASASVPWQASGSTFITYEDPASIKIKVNYAQTNNLGGIMIYDLLGGFTPDAPPGEKHLLLKSLINEMDK